jgi:hypothetical protein
MLLIKTNEELRKYVKINASKDFGSYEMFVADAQEKYIEPYFGSELLKKLESETDDALREKICRALGPFSLALATDEFSINFGETGHTVIRTDKLAPASDAKIEKATESLYNRAWLNLDKAIKYVIKHPEKYSEWKTSEYSSKISTLLFADADDFQEKGLIYIDASPLTFHYLRLLVLRIEKSETFMFLPPELRQNSDKRSENIVEAMQAYTGSRVAALHTSQATHTNRSKPGERENMTEFKPVLRPLYDDTDFSGNYFESQAEFWKGVLLDALTDAGHIDSDARTMKYNTADNKIFIANATSL